MSFRSRRLFRYLIFVFLLVSPALAKQLVTVEEALKSIYPGCEARSETRYLSPAQVKEASKRAGSIVESAVVIRYVVKCAGAGAGATPAFMGGYAYTDTHR